MNKTMDKIVGLNEYQRCALETADYPQEMKIIYPTLGLSGESGEVAEKVKKTYRDNEGKWDLDRCIATASEVGDCLWYIAVIANDLGFTLQEIAEMNYEKLQSRKKRNKIHGDGDNR